MEREMALSKPEDTEAQLDQLDKQLRDIPVSMRVFTLSMRSLYAVQSVGSSSETARKVTKLRDETRKDAMVYVKGVLPLSISLVRSIQDFFEVYEELDMKEWAENLKEIMDDVKGYKQCCSEIVQLHEKIMIPLKTRQDEAKVLVCELTDLSAKYEKKKVELKESADSKMSWAVGLAFVPGVNLIASPILAASSHNDLAESIAKGVQCEIFESSAILVDKTMIPALSAFIDGLNATAGFFSVMEQEVESFLVKGDKAMERKKALHYKLMRKKAKVINNNCRKFYAMIPGVRTDLLCIPDSGTDDNYVEKWLTQQREEIEKKYGFAIRSQLKKLMLYLSVRGVDKLMIESE